MPERWQNRRERTTALATCLQCPRRRWCAQEALRVHASWGMWAGVWIDGRLSPVEPLLRAIAADPPDLHYTPAATLPVAKTPDLRLPLPRRRPPRRPGSVRAAILARSSGHCEVMRAGCILSADILVSRVRSLDAKGVPTPAAAFAACHDCALTVTDPAFEKESVQLGYVVVGADQAAATPFSWRATRWVRFDDCGRVHDVDPALQSRRAS
ncbi:WhiB family transcriptional regulator [Mycolicibacterium sp. P1-18]|uniref:WhiB family transcriptional regulator n=1 Tax=Mycolicibacterium sp. P1-18 TaxID=2024615 RepID=UPI001565D0D6